MKAMDTLLSGCDKRIPKNNIYRQMDARAFDIGYLLSDPGKSSSGSFRHIWEGEVRVAAAQSRVCSILVALFNCHAVLEQRLQRLCSCCQIQRELVNPGRYFPYQAILESRQGSCCQIQEEAVQSWPLVSLASCFRVGN